MSAQGRALVGVITTAVFAGLTVMLTLEHRYEIAAVLAVLTLIRGYYSVGQLRWAFGSDDDDEEDADESESP